MGEQRRVADYLALGVDRTIGVRPGKVECGQGILTAFATEVADALAVDLARVRLEPVQTGFSPDEGYTAGSLSVSTSARTLRQAASTLRRHLAELAAAHLDCRTSDFSIADGIFVGPAWPNPLSYWDLIAEVDSQLQIGEDENSPPARMIAAERLDLPEKFAGGASFLHDLALDGMLHGRVIRPHGRGARLMTVVSTRADDLAGVVSIVRDGSFFGVVADREEVALRCAELLRVDAVWSSSDQLPDEAQLESYLRTQPTSDVGHDAGHAVSVSIIDRPTDPPLGAGEIAQGPTAAAIGNALRAATGIRVRRLPLTTAAIVGAIGASA